MKVLTATGVEKLDNDLLKILPENNIEVVGNCFHRSVLLNVIRETCADTVVISPTLNGNEDIVDLIKLIREMGTRVIVLPGSPDMNTTKELIKKVVPYGVYDYVFDKPRVKPEDVMQKLLNPGTLGDIPKEIKEAAMVEQKISKDLESRFTNIDDILSEEKTIVQERQKKFAFKPKVNINKVCNVIGRNVKNIVSTPKFSDRDLNNIVSIWSPAPTGATFVAVNYASTLAQDGYDVALVGVDGSINTWLKTQNEGLQEVLSDPLNVLEFAYQPQLIPGLFVYGFDKESKPKSILTLCNALQEQVDIVVLDCSSLPCETIKDILNLAGGIILVADMDLNHLTKIKKTMDSIEEEINLENFVLLVNRYIESPRLPLYMVEKTIGLNVSYIIPDLYQEVLESIKEGVPVTLFSTEIRQVFEKIKPLHIETIKG